MPNDLTVNDTRRALLSDIADGYVHYDLGSARYGLSGDEHRSSDLTIDGRVEELIHAGWAIPTRARTAGGKPTVVPIRLTAAGTRLLEGATNAAA